MGRGHIENTERTHGDVRMGVLRIVSTEADMVLLLLCLVPSLSFSQDVRPGHDHVKEHHMHVYWFQNNQQQTEEALRLRDLLIEEVAAKRFIVVLPGVTSDILPGLDDSKVPNIHMGPYLPHPIGNFEVWVPQEGFSKALSFMMYHRGNLTILIHPLAKIQLLDNTRDAMWLGSSFPIDTSQLDPTGGHDPQYPELGLGYSAV